MKSIDMFLDEQRIEITLKSVYQEYWDRLLDAIPTLTEEEFKQLSNPFLVKPLPAYHKAKRKVLFVGQETNGWDCFQITLDRFNYKDRSARRDEIIEYLQWMYEDLRFHRKWDHTPFWKGVRRLYKAICPREEDDAFLNTQLVRFDLGEKRPPQHIEDALQKEYNVLPGEISALAPDVIVFVTGPYYDERLRETFRNVRRLGDHMKFEAIAGFNENALARIIHPDLPYHTYRTYHPRHSLQMNEKTVFIPIENTISALVK